MSRFTRVIGLDWLLAYRQSPTTFAERRLFEDIREGSVAVAARARQGWPSTETVEMCEHYGHCVHCMRKAYKWLAEAYCEMERLDAQGEL